MSRWVHFPCLGIWTFVTALVFLRWFLSLLLVKDLEVCLFVQVSLMFWAWHSPDWLQTPQVTFFSAFQTWIIYSVEQCCCYFYDCCAFVPSLHFCMSFQTPQPPALSPTCSETQSEHSVLVFFLREWVFFSGKIVHLGWKVLMPPTRMT